MKRYIWIPAVILMTVLLLIAWGAEKNDRKTVGLSVLSVEEISRLAITDQAYVNHPAFEPGELLIDLKDTITNAEIEQMERDYSLDMDFNSVFSGNYRLMTAMAGRGREEGLISALLSDPRVEYAEPNYYYHLYGEPMAGVPNDPLYRYQWNMEKINLRTAWDYNRGDGVIVAVIDTGVGYRDYERFHRLEDLENTLFVKGYNFVDRNEYPLDDNAHGSHVAGTIAQTTDNGKGVAGIAPRAKIMPLKVLAGNGYGKLSDIASAIRYSADNKVRVINMSLGGPFPSVALKMACDYARKKGAVIVCAAGNSRSDRVGYPAGFSSCIAVSATRFDDKLAPYSNRGKRIDLSAPGGDMTVDQNGDGRPDGILQNTIQQRNPEKEGYYLFQGTSMAAPHVAGVAALVAGQGITDPDEVISIMKKTARRNGINLKEGYGAGIVDAGSALKNGGSGIGWLRLVVAVIVLLIFTALFGGVTGKSFLSSPLFALGLVVGSSGLFFLRFIGWPAGILSRPLSDMDSALLGAGAHMNPIFFSVIIPFILAVILYKTAFQRLVAGLSLGMAVRLLMAFFSLGDVCWIPGVFWLDRVWLLGNTALSILLALVLLRNPGQSQIKDGKLKKSKTGGN